MKTAVYFCFLLVILIQSVDSLPISCIGGNGCEPTDSGSGSGETTSVKKTENTKPPSTTAAGTAIVPTTTTAATTVATTTTAATTGNTEWPYRRVICPPFDPYLDDTLLEEDRILSVENSNVPTSAKPATKQINSLVTKVGF
jgi:hypothetical protein